MNQISVDLILYSKCIATNKQVATFILRIPKFIQAQINSHRALSKNSASSRAVPAKKMRAKVLNTPFIPIYFGENKAGMQSGESLRGFRLFIARKVWLWARYLPVFFHYLGEKLNLHKEVLNRLIEPWIITEVLLTGTEWANFLKLRNNSNAQPEIQEVARQIDKILKKSKPQELEVGEWHLPFIKEKEKRLDLERQKKVSTARCARVSYFLFDGKASNVESDINLCDKLLISGHWSPFEHTAQALNGLERSGNFVGWKQYRKEFEGEDGGDYAVINGSNS